MSTRHEHELVALRKLAEELARGRNERTTTGHLLAAIASTPGGAADLLRERRLDVDVLLKASRVATDDAPDALARAVQRARDFASRSTMREPSSIHLLFALCQERSTAAHRAIEQCGADIGKLRTAAMQLATGVVAQRRQMPSATQLAPTSVRMPLDPRPLAPSSISPPRPVQTSFPTQPHTPAKPAPTTLAPPATATPSTPSSPPPTRGPSLHAKPRRPRPTTLATTPPQTQTRANVASRFSLDPKLFPALTQLGKNLTLAAERGELDVVVGRDEEIERTLDVLAKRRSNNPCLVGLAGVGKTSVVRGLAQRIASGQDVMSLDDRIVIEIEPSALLAGTGVRGALAERIATIKDEVMRSEGRVVVFFDEVHTLFGADAGDEASSELKMALAKGELPCIGASTFEEYKRYIDSDPALARRFTPIEVVELSPEEAVLALEGISGAFEKHHHARYTKEALAASVLWSARYVPDKALPDKAVGILDLAGARARRRDIHEVTPEQIAEVVAELAGVPKERLLETDGERMLRMEELLASRIVGHKSALGRIASVLRRNASGFRSKRPIGSFLLLGPTGVGKTETAKAIAECLFYSPHAMTRLDLSEYAEAHAIARLVGAPPGYVGHEAGGQLTEAVRRRPYQVVLLDEIEKAHRDVLEAFLQVFDEGRLTDGRGRTIDFTNTVIILTSNLGADIAVPSAAKARIGFASSRPSTAASDREISDLKKYEEAVVASARSGLPPELYNRFDEVLAFAPLTRADVTEIANRMLRELGEELERTRGVHLDVAASAIETLMESGGFEPALGARPMRRAIARLIEAPIAEMILRGELARGDVATVDAENGVIEVDAVTPTSAPSAARYG